MESSDIESRLRKALDEAWMMMEMTSQMCINKNYFSTWKETPKRVPFLLKCNFVSVSSTRILAGKGFLVPESDQLLLI